MLIAIFSLYFYQTHYIKDLFKDNIIPRQSIKPIPRNLVYSITGFFLGSANILENALPSRGKLLIIIIPIFILLIYYQNLIKKVFYVVNIDIIIVNLLIIFGLFPFDKIKDSKIITIIKLMTSYTGGIYYLHKEIRSIFKNYFVIIKNQYLSGCFLIYFISYWVCFIGTKLFSKTNLIYLFN